jgi:hypothetical protein
MKLTPYISLSGQQQETVKAFFANYFGVDSNIIIFNSWDLNSENNVALHLSFDGTTDDYNAVYSKLDSPTAYELLTSELNREYPDIFGDHTLLPFRKL